MTLKQLVKKALSEYRVREVTIQTNKQELQDHGRSREIWSATLVSINDLTLGYQTRDSASSSKFHHLALLVVLVSHSSNFHHWPLLALLVVLYSVALG